jgi:hypothetical protein
VIQARSIFSPSHRGGGGIDLGKFMMPASTVPQVRKLLTFTAHM